jgi:hypothetical protein
MRDMVLKYYSASYEDEMNITHKVIHELKTGTARKAAKIVLDFTIKSLELYDYDLIMVKDLADTCKNKTLTVEDQKEKSLYQVLEQMLANAYEYLSTRLKSGSTEISQTELFNAILQNLPPMSHSSE